jgi:hypothetical protein
MPAHYHHLVILAVALVLLVTTSAGQRSVPEKAISQAKTAGFHGSQQVFRFANLKSASYDDEMFTPVGDLSLLNESGYTTFGHPLYPHYGVRMKRTRFCDETVRFETLLDLSPSLAINGVDLTELTRGISISKRGTCFSTSLRVETNQTRTMLYFGRMGVCNVQLICQTRLSCIKQGPAVLRPWDSSWNSVCIRLLNDDQLELTDSVFPRPL